MRSSGRSCRRRSSSGVSAKGADGGRPPVSWWRRTRSTRRSWIVTARHFLEPPTTQQIHLTTPGRKDRTKLVVVASSPDADVTLLVAEGIVLPAVNLKEIAKLGDDVWVLAFPWGRRLTVVGGVVSQISADAGDDAFEGPARMIDASVSYGASGGGVFDARTGELIGIIESYRTARVGTTPPRSSRSRCRERPLWCRPRPSCG